MDPTAKQVINDVRRSSSVETLLLTEEDMKQVVGSGSVDTFMCHATAAHRHAQEQCVNQLQRQAVSATHLRDYITMPNITTGMLDAFQTYILSLTTPVAKSFDSILSIAFHKTHELWTQTHFQCTSIEALRWCLEHQRLPMHVVCLDFLEPNAMWRTCAAERIDVLDLLLSYVTHSPIPEHFVHRVWLQALDRNRATLECVQKHFGQIPRACIDVILNAWDRKYRERDCTVADWIWTHRTLFAPATKNNTFTFFSDIVFCAAWSNYTMPQDLQLTVKTHPKTFDAKTAAAFARLPKTIDVYFAADVYTAAQWSLQDEEEALEGTPSLKVLTLFINRSN